MNIKLSSHEFNAHNDRREFLEEAQRRVEAIENELNRIVEERKYKQQVKNNEEPQDNFFPENKWGRESIGQKTKYGNKGNRNPKEEMKNSFFKRLNAWNKRNNMK